MKLLPVLLGLVLASCASTKEKPSIFGDPLYVNGKRVTDDEIKLALIYGPCRLKLDMCKLDLVIEEEIARQAAAGRTSAEVHARYMVSDEECEAEYQVDAGEFKEQYPTLDIGTEVCRAFRSVDWYRDYLRKQMLFDRVFLPDDPTDWPKTTADAVNADPAGGKLLLSNEQESYQERIKAAGKSTGQLPRRDPLTMEFLRQIVREAVYSKITFRTHPDGIDAKLALWVDTNGDGKPELGITIDELWDEVQDTVTETEIAEAKQWCITSIATRNRLDREGALLSGEERKKVLADLERTSNDTGFPLEQQAVRDLGFPSIESYCEFYALSKGFERTLAPKLADGPKGEPSPILAEYLPHANQILGLGMVDCEVLLVSAMDIPRFRWKPDGWSLARQEAQALRVLYDRDPSPGNWTRLREANCEYWDAPLPLDMRGSTDRLPKRNGKFGSLCRNLLIAGVGESAYTEWATGECIADRMFFDQEVGTVAGPYRGPLGWYLTRVSERTPPTRPLDLDKPRHKQVLKEDYLRAAFIKYSKQAVAQADVRGWKPL